MSITIHQCPSPRSLAKDRRVPSPVLLFALFALLLFASGCSTVSYYRQAIAGQLTILAKREPIKEILADPETPPTLREKLQLVLDIRQFAHDQLHLPVDGLYLTYADIKRPLAVWNVHAAKPFSLRPKTWWYPVVGQLQYRGFFTEKGARDYARTLEAQGYEVHLAGVEAYSTLGWFRDPVMNTFLVHPPSDIAEILFHELAHQRLFIADETAWNEAFAVAVAEEGVQRWLRSTGRTLESEIYSKEALRNREFVDLLSSTRERLVQLYDSLDGLHLDPASPGPAYYLAMQSKRAILADLDTAYLQFKLRWNGFTGYDGWFSEPINNAHLAAVDSYFRLVPLFQSLLATKNGDLEQFYLAVQSLSNLPDLERRQRLAEIDDARKRTLTADTPTTSTAEGSSPAPANPDSTESLAHIGTGSP